MVEVTSAEQIELCLAHFRIDLFTELEEIQASADTSLPLFLQIRAGRCCFVVIRFGGHFSMFWVRWR